MKHEAHIEGQRATEGSPLFADYRSVRATCALVLGTGTGRDELDGSLMTQDCLSTIGNHVR